MNEMDVYLAHRIECLEAAVRRYVQASRLLIKAIREEDYDRATKISLEIEELLEEDGTRC